jgi:PhzF family phenazine biosynthesis protein
LGQRKGAGNYKLYLNHGSIDVSVETNVTDSFCFSLYSPAPSQYTNTILQAFSLLNDDVDSNFPIHYASAGAKYLIIVLKEHDKLSSMNDEFDVVKNWMAQQPLTTINLLCKASSSWFHSSNLFPSGGVYEDPATGSAAAAFAGYLRDIAWSGSSSFEVLQGEDMGSPSRLLVEYQPEIVSSIKVSSEARYIVEEGQ